MNNEICITDSGEYELDKLKSTLDILKYLKTHNKMFIPYFYDKYEQLRLKCKKLYERGLIKYEYLNNTNGPYMIECGLTPKGVIYYVRLAEIMYYETILKEGKLNYNCMHFKTCKKSFVSKCEGCNFNVKKTVGTTPIKNNSQLLTEILPSENHYTNGTDFGKIICFDLDGVILKFDGWKGENVFGEVIQGARPTINWLKENGWYIIIFTTRLITEELVNYLYNAGIVYDDINGRKIANVVHCQSYYPDITDYTSHMISLTHYWKHNPSKASIKPIATVYVDDCDWRQGGKNFDNNTWWLLLNKIAKRFHDGKI